MLFFATRLPKDQKEDSYFGPTILGEKDVRKAVRWLRVQGTKPFQDGYYHADLHPDIEYDQQGDPAVMNIFKYSSRGEDTPFVPSGAPVIYGAKFYRTINTDGVRLDRSKCAIIVCGSSVGDPHDLYACYVYGPNAEIVPPMPIKWSL